MSNTSDKHRSAETRESRDKGVPKLDEALVKFLPCRVSWMKWMALDSSMGLSLRIWSVLGRKSSIDPKSFASNSVPLIFIDRDCEKVE